MVASQLVGASSSVGYSSSSSSRETLDRLGDREPCEEYSLLPCSYESWEKVEAFDQVSHSEVESVAVEAEDGQ